MRTAQILLLLLLCFACSSPGLSYSHLLKQNLTERVVTLASAEIGVRELTGNNDGKAVERYLDYVHLRKGDPWCAAFVSWVFGKAGIAKPRSG